MSENETVTVSTFVSIEPNLAFEIFTEDIDLWWKRGARFRSPGDERMRFEPGPGGRLISEDGEGGSRDIGKVIAWEPDAGRLVFEYRATSFAPGETTEVEVRFEAAEGGSRIVLEHRGLEALRADHPARHALAGGALVALYGNWWADMLVAMGNHARGQRSEPRES